jgi:UDP-N-acetylmuramate dehydrogenase
MSADPAQDTIGARGSVAPDTLRPGNQKNSLDLPRLDGLTVDVAEIASCIRGEMRLSEPMSKHTSLGIGGSADFFFRPMDLQDIRLIMQWIRENKLGFKVVGNGTNLLVSDKGLRGAVIQLTCACCEMKFDGAHLILGAGTKLGVALERAAQAGLSGLEATVGIPGTVGGAIVTNAGTDTGSMGDLVEEIIVMDQRGEILPISREHLRYSYRYSNLVGLPLLVLEARLRLDPGEPREIRAKIERLRMKRAQRQPLRARSAGSVFKNPPFIAAGKLLDRAGAKGMRVGDAQVSYKHANFIVNRGQATASDLRRLTEDLQALVLQTYGIWLEPEIEFVSDW